MLFLDVDEYRGLAVWAVVGALLVLVSCGLLIWLAPVEVWRLWLSRDGRRYLRDGRRLVRRYPRKAPGLFAAATDDKHRKWRPGLVRLYEDEGLNAVFVLPDAQQALREEYRTHLLVEGAAVLGVHAIEYVAIRPRFRRNELIVRVIPTDQSEGNRDVELPAW